jgi:hypothetical protein
MPMIRGSGQGKAWLGAAGCAALFAVLRIAGVFTTERVFTGPGTNAATQLLFTGVLTAFGGCILAACHRMGLQWSTTRGRPGYFVSMAAGVHFLGWCAAGVVVGVASATGSLHQAPWIGVLLVLVGSAAVIFTAGCVLLRLRQT